MVRTSRVLMNAGALLGAAIGIIGSILPHGAGGLRWFLHAPTSTVGLPFSLALIIAGAVVGRLEREEASTDVRSSSELGESLLPGTEVDALLSARRSEQHSNER